MHRVHRVGMRERETERDGHVCRCQFMNSLYRRLWQFPARRRRGRFVRFGFCKKIFQDASYQYRTIHTRVLRLCFSFLPFSFFFIATGMIWIGFFHDSRQSSRLRVRTNACWGCMDVESVMFSKFLEMKFHSENIMIIELFVHVTFRSYRVNFLF